jgi:hypothetical protein
MILNDMSVVNTCEYMYDLSFIILELSFIPIVLVNFSMDYDDVMLTLSGLPHTFLYGRVDGVQGA